jgi:hypothetical protein
VPGLGLRHVSPAALALVPGGRSSSCHKVDVIPHCSRRNQVLPVTSIKNVIASVGIVGVMAALVPVNGFAASTAGTQRARTTATARHTPARIVKKRPVVKKPVVPRRRTTHRHR